MSETEVKPKSVSRKRPRRLFKGLVMAAAAALIFSFGVGVGNGRITFSSQNSNQKTLPASLDHASVDQVYQALKANFDGKLDINTLNDGMKQGLVKAAGDPYTEYFTAKEYGEFNSQLSGTFTGIGAELSKDAKDNIVVVAPIAGYPAEKAGLKPKDIIIEIDGKTTTGMTVDDAVQKIRGPKDTQVKIKVARNGEAKDFTITRQDISVPSVDHKVENGICYIKISRFGEDTAELSRKAAEDCKSQNVKGVVLDMRSNPGGLLDAAVAVSSLWLPEGKTVLTERRDGVVTNTYKATGDPVLQGIPTVVLIDEGSASASEITAGALKDNGVAKLIGQKSYGKGSVQQLVKLNGGGVLKVTIARWYTPNGKNIDKEGITPDTAVTISADDVKNGLDPQKDAAIKALNQ